MSKERRSRQDARERLLSLERSLLERPSSNGGDLRFHLVYPNSYWVAMSNLGFQAVYGIFAQTPGVSVERGFLPDEFEDSKIAAQPWRTFESNRLMSECDMLGFSLSFETDYPHLIKILKNQHLLSADPIEREKRSHSSFGSPLLIAGGTAVTLNPEPVADLFDVIVLGEAEELLAEMIDVYRDCKAKDFSRLELLKALAQIEGIYVPRFYSPSYYANDSVAAVAVEPGVPVRPTRRFVADLSKYPTYSNILTSETEFSSMFLTETGRGCEVGCRFCVAGYIYRPVRKRSEESIAATVQIGLENSKAVGFVGASVSSHKSIAKLASSVASSGARASLSSLMSQKVTKELAASLSESEYKTVALAPEAGSERLRLAAGKRVSNSQVIEAATNLAEAGIKGFKLYFIVGLPTETDEDVDAIAELAIAVRDAVIKSSRGSGQAGWVTLSVNPFIPKASTPFQWEPMVARAELEAKIERIRDFIKKIPNLEMKFESPRESYFQGLLSRGDRRVLKLLIAAEEQGRDWKWLVQKSSERILADVPTLDFYASRRIPFDELLPWEVMDSRVDRNLLRREALRAHGLGEDPVAERVRARMAGLPRFEAVPNSQSDSKSDFECRGGEGQPRNEAVPADVI